MFSLSPSALLHPPGFHQRHGSARGHLGVSLAHPGQQDAAPPRRRWEEVTLLARCSLISPAQPRFPAGMRVRSSPTPSIQGSFCPALSCPGPFFPEPFVFPTGGCVAHGVRVFALLLGEELGSLRPPKKQGKGWAWRQQVPQPRSAPPSLNCEVSLTKVNSKVLRSSQLVSAGEGGNPMLWDTLGHLPYSSCPARMTRAWRSWPWRSPSRWRSAASGGWWASG